MLYLTRCSGSRLKSTSRVIARHFNARTENFAVTGRVISNTAPKNSIAMLELSNWPLARLDKARQIITKNYAACTQASFKFSILPSRLLSQEKTTHPCGTITIVESRVGGGMGGGTVSTRLTVLNEPSAFSFFFYLYIPPSLLLLLLLLLCLFFASSFFNRLSSSHVCPGLAILCLCYTISSTASAVSFFPSCS
jgi:hypothetical protein